MRVHIASDVHGATQALATAAQGSDLFICLGDLLLYLDYDDPRQGAFADVFGADVAEEYISLRLQKRFDEARALTQQVWDEKYGDQGKDRMQMMGELVQGQYREIFTALPDGTYFTFGNVDIPALGLPFVTHKQHYVDATTVEFSGVTFGFVGGGLTSIYRTPNELTIAEYDQKVAALGHADVLCSHIPPRVPELMYDVVARRFEVGSQSLLDYVLDVQPKFAVFGHVHNPLVRRFRIGRTECLNVGHFRSLRRPFVLEIPAKT